MQSENQNTRSILAVTLLSSAGSVMAALSTQYSESALGTFLFGTGIFFIGSSALLLIRLAFKYRRQR